jgi:hypothetical protein
MIIFDTKTAEGPISRRAACSTVKLLKASWVSGTSDPGCAAKGSTAPMQIRKRYAMTVRRMIPINESGLVRDKTHQYYNGQN